MSTNNINDRAAFEVQYRQNVDQRAADQVVEIAWRSAVGKMWRAALSTTPSNLTEGEGEIKFLEYWLSFVHEPIGQECCGRGYGECCGEAVPVYPNLAELTEAMAARHKELCAESFVGGCREGRHVPNEGDSRAATKAAAPAAPKEAK